MITEMNIGENVKKIPKKQDLLQKIFAKSPALNTILWAKLKVM